jgi:hypothetical protein
VRNGGFEEELGPAWLRRTPENMPCRAVRDRVAPHTDSACLMLENSQPAFNRWRQGSDHRLVLGPGSLVELSGWIKAELSEKGSASIQLYCMGKKETILAQPSVRARPDRSGWQPVQLLAEVPGGTQYAMVYVQADGSGKAWFDDVRLTVVRKARAEQALSKMAVITDLAEDDACLRNVRILLARDVTVAAPGAGDAPLAGCAAAVVLVREGKLPHATAEALEQFARRGGRVLMDLRALAQCRGWRTQAERLAPGVSKEKAASRVARQMATGLRVVRASPITAGFQPGQTIPYAGPDGQLLALAETPPAGPTEVLAVTPQGRPALVRLPLERGAWIGVDMLSLGEPEYTNVAGYYKYLFLANAVAGAEFASLAEYYPHKYRYAELVDEMREAARRLPAMRLVDEGPACGQYRMYSLNLGRPGKPLYFLYAAAHGSEWEPGYGLFTFAKHVAQGRLGKTIDLEKVSIKILPILNPSGYDAPSRQNAHGVDLNRQGDHCWKEYVGRDSSHDGRYGPGDYDWKGTAPFNEPEAQVYRRIAENRDLYCVLDFHGNGSATDNKVGVLPSTAATDNARRAYELQWLVNQRLQRRFVLHQVNEKDFSPYLLDRLYPDGPRPMLINTSARERHGLLVELTAGYADSYGSVLQTEVTCEICRALFEAFPPPAGK